MASGVWIWYDRNMEPREWFWFRTYIVHSPSVISLSVSHRTIIIHNVVENLCKAIQKLRSWAHWASDARSACSTRAEGSDSTAWPSHMLQCPRWSRWHPSHCQASRRQPAIGCFFPYFRSDCAIHREIEGSTLTRIPYGIGAGPVQRLGIAYLRRPKALQAQA